MLTVVTFVQKCLLVRGLSTTLTHPILLVELTDLFNEIDSGKNGSIEIDELVSNLLEPRWKPTPNPRY